MNETRNCTKVVYEEKRTKEVDELKKIKGLMGELIRRKKKNSEGRRNEESMKQ